MTSQLDFPVVGIGASAGGLPALRALLAGLPVSPGCALVVVLHLSPDQPSEVDHILQPSSLLPVIQVNQPVVIVPDRVFVIPSDRILKMADSHLILDHLERPKGGLVTIDIFFRTLAQAHRERAIAVVLSGMGSDGAAGLAYVKEQGGIAIAQDPLDAKESSMPLAAIETGMVDFILPARAIPDKLLELDKNARAIQQIPFAEGKQADESSAADQRFNAGQYSLHNVLDLLRAHTGHDFRHYKSATLLRGVARRMQVRGVLDLPGYHRLLEQDATERNALLNDFFIGVTTFFRDREVYRALEQRVLPDIFGRRQAEDQVRAWVAPCSTGEEAYSLAMLMADAAAALPAPPGIQIFATDINEQAIVAARAGRYPLSIEAHVSPERLRRYFVKEVKAFRARKSLRDIVVFAAHGLLRDPPYSMLDLITCRNFLIYLNREMQWPVLEMFHYALNPGGYLVLGNAESADALPDLFVLVDRQNRIYQAKPAVRAAGHAVPVFGSLANRAAAMKGNEAGAAGTEPVLRSGSERPQPMQAATDELQIRIEAQQSTIEELMTVNNELKLRLKEITRANDDLENLISAVDQPTIFIDSAMRLQRYTPRTIEIFNFIPSDVGRSLFDITHQLDYPQLCEDVKAVIGSGQRVEREVTCRDHRYFVTRLLPYRTTDDRVAGAVLTFFDITERKQADVALRQSEEQFRTLASLVPVLLWRTDPSGDQVSLNQHWLEYTGQTLAQTQGGGWLAAIHPDDRPNTERVFREAYRDEKPLEVQHRLRSATGEYRWFLVRQQPLRDAAGRVVQWFGAAFDLQEQRVAMEALRDSETRLAAELAGMRQL